MTGQYNCTTEDTSPLASHHFAKVSFLQLAKIILLAAERKLELRDLAVLLAILSRMKWNSGRSFIKASAVAELLKLAYPMATASIKRLKRQKIIVSTTDPESHQRCLLINPWIICMGNRKRVGYLKKTFMKELNDENPFMEEDGDIQEYEIDIQQSAGDLIQRAINHST